MFPFIIDFFILWPNYWLFVYYRYPPHGRRAATVEHGVPWERLRAPPVDTPPHDLHISDCLCDLHPGDHVEIQWRRNKEFPYGLFLYSTCSYNFNNCIGCLDTFWHFWDIRFPSDKVNRFWVFNENDYLSNFWLCISIYMYDLLFLW